MKGKFITLAILAVIVMGCRTTQVANTDSGSHTSTTQPMLEQRITSFANTQGAWTTLQAGGNVKVTGGKSLSSAMQMRMIRNRAIYISLRPMLGIEVGKIVIAHDSLLVVDKYYKRYIAEPLSLITNGIPVTVGDMQDILLGHAFVLGVGTVNQQTKSLLSISPMSNSRYRLAPIKQPEGFSYEFVIDEQNHLQSLTVTPTAGKQPPYTATYASIQATLAGLVAHHADVHAQVGASKFSLSLDLKNVTWGSEVTIDDSKPVGYKRMDGRQITSILDGAATSAP